MKSAPWPPLLMASLAGGLVYPLLWTSGLPDPAMIGLKGVGVGLLALLAAMQARSVDGWLLAAVMGFGALGDVLLDIRFEAGVVAFGVGHIVAIALYGRNRRAIVAVSQRALAAALLLFGAAMPFLLIESGDPRLIGLVGYSLLLSAMAAMAWLSRFPRYWTGLGAVMFVVSDALIAARMGPLADAAWANWAIWLLYYLGQLLIFIGVSATLRRDGA
ncbi:MAG: lysoplasmalogenase [Sphingomonadaceae bacterium]|nr:lysoplasmalogenase [Sphingomonadaceae bacterium]